LIKTVLYTLLLLTTATRLTGVVILLALGSVNLPTTVLATTSFTVIYGIFLLIRRFVLTLHLKHFIQFFTVQSAVFIFNLSFVSNNIPLQITGIEALVTGSVLDVLINVVAIYYCVRNIRRNKFSPAGYF